MSEISNFDLVERVNNLITKHSLPVPRFVSSRYISYQFWSILFTKLFGIRCDISLRTTKQRLEMISCCLNTLQSLVGISLDHIQPIQLLEFDLQTMINLIEIAELWSEHFVDEQQNESDEINEQVDNGLAHSSRNSDPKCPNSLGHSSQKSDPKYSNTESNKLANLLCKSLKNQIIAIEIENKIKAYLGDVTSSSKCNNNNDIRSSRQSIVRIRAIQPPLATFDFNLNRNDKCIPILSVELERYFPDVDQEIFNQIQRLEHHLLLLHRKRNQTQNQGSSLLNEMLKCAINRQRERILAQQQDQQSSSSNRLLTRSIQQRQIRAQRAVLHERINSFYKSATAAYLDARSCLERILVEEFRKVDSHQRDHIANITKYLRVHQDNLELDKVRAILKAIPHF